jgi:4a-hydroxytetrahydrobiopterin dehydratase
VPELLNRDQIDDVLAAMPGWSGGPERLVRDVEVPESDREALRRSVMMVADELDHHPEIQATEQGLRFVLWTHSEGGVTAKDVELAAAIDQVLSGSRSTE